MLKFEDAYLQNFFSSSLNKCINELSNYKYYMQVKQTSCWLSFLILPQSCLIDKLFHFKMIIRYLNCQHEPTFRIKLISENEAPLLRYMLSVDWDPQGQSCLIGCSRCRHIYTYTMQTAIATISSTEMQKWYCNWRSWVNSQCSDSAERDALRN